MIDDTFNKITDLIREFDEGRYETAIALKAGDPRIKAKGGPISKPCRVVSEENYQCGIKALNLLRDMARENRP